MSLHEEAGARQLLTLPGEFPMRRNGVLRQPTIAYETWGNLNDAGNNAILLFTGLSPSAHAASSAKDPSPGWWEEMLGSQRPIDTDRFFVICVNSLGSCFGSTGPASHIPSRKATYNIDYPVLSLEDIANSAIPVLEHLGIERLFGVVGCSMGGMTALAFSVLHSNRTDRLISVSSAARAAPFAIALRSLQREMVRRDPDWQAGRYTDAGPISGMRLARKLGMISYRSAAEWAQRFGRERVAAERVSNDAFCIDFEVESYLEAHANKFTGDFDANCYLFLSRAMDLFDVADYGGSVASGVARAGLREALIIGVESDILFPLGQQQELADALVQAGCDVQFDRLPSIQGHDSFLVDMDRFRPVIGNWLATRQGDA
ncbi:MAG: homoserine O-acetyltransferase [Pseudomonadota bacterium]